MPSLPPVATEDFHSFRKDARPSSGDQDSSSTDGESSSQDQEDSNADGPLSRDGLDAFGLDSHMSFETPSSISMGASGGVDLPPSLELHDFGLDACIESAHFPHPPTEAAEPTGDLAGDSSSPRGESHIRLL